MIENLIDNFWVNLIYKIIVPFILMPIAYFSESDNITILLIICLIPLAIGSFIWLVVLLIGCIIENF